VSFGVVESLLDIAAKVTDSETNGFVQNVGALRVLRVLRVVRIVKVVRVMRFFRELRMMVFSILGSMKNLLWVMVILGLTFYLFGITFTSAVTDHLVTPEQWRDEQNVFLLKAFGTVDKSALSLFMSMSGGENWTYYYEALGTLAPQYQWLFLLFISFTTFAIVNIVTGVFVQAALESNIHDHDVVAQEEIRSKKESLKSMRVLFEEMDEGASGEFTMEEFVIKLQDERVVAYFHSLKLDVSDAKSLFRLLDTDSSGLVSIEEFVTGIYTLQGESRTLDMKIMQLEVSQLREVSAETHVLIRELRLGHDRPFSQQVSAEPNL